MTGLSQTQRDALFDSLTHIRTNLTPDQTDEAANG